MPLFPVGSVTEATTLWVPSPVVAVALQAPPLCAVVLDVWAPTVTRRAVPVAIPVAVPAVVRVLCW